MEPQTDADDCRSLIFEESQGIPPARGTLEYDILYACSEYDVKAWEKLLDVPVDAIEDAIRTLNRLGWRFHFATIQ